jgi:four helix bundle protein
VVSKGSRGQGFKGSSEMLKNYKDLKVRQKSYELCLKIYQITAKFPNEERYGLTSQIRRCAVSIPSNIAEGYGRKTTLDYIRMLYISYGSVCELETQILLAGDLGFIDKGELDTAKKDIAEIERMLKALIKSLENKRLSQRNEDPVIGESLTPGILGPSSPTKLEKNQEF